MTELASPAVDNMANMANMANAALVSESDDAIESSNSSLGPVSDHKPTSAPQQRQSLVDLSEIGDAPEACNQLSNGEADLPVQEPLVWDDPNRFLPKQISQEAIEALPDDLSLDELSDEELEHLFHTGLEIYAIGGNKIVRISKNLVIKGGHLMSKGQAETQRLAAEAGVSAPSVHRFFSRPFSDPWFPERTECWFLVMDFVDGQTLQQLWPSMDEGARRETVDGVAGIVARMQSIAVEHLPPGPVAESSPEPWLGPWFSEYGAGPFSSAEEMEAWYNHKLDVCIRLKQAPPDLPRFEFKRLVLTHHDITPRNIIVEADSRRLVLVDWGHAGIYPIGFEQAALCVQSGGKWDREFGKAIWESLSDRRDKEISQLKGIAYGLTTGVFL